MRTSGIRSVLAVGVVDVASLAASAKRAGYDVYAVDYCGDQDLEQNCIASLSLMSQMKVRSYAGLFGGSAPRGILRLAGDLERTHKIDALLLSSGLDDSPDILQALDDLAPILGNAPNLIVKVRDKSNFFMQLEGLGIAFPRTVAAQDIEEVKSASRDLGFPVVLKPRGGFGGVGIRKASSQRELEDAFTSVHTLNRGVLVQEYVTGTHASASVIAVPGKALTLAVTEQLLGIHDVGQLEPFGYCGNIVPLSAPMHVTERCGEVAEKVASQLGLVGSNGVDLVVSQEGEPYVIEVNPRFQGTIECVERVLGLNVVDAHVNACTERKLPPKIRKPSEFCMRLVLFAKKRSAVPDLSILEECRDVPQPGLALEKGEPLCSIVLEGHSRTVVLEKARRTYRSIYDSLFSN